MAVYISKIKFTYDSLLFSKVYSTANNRVRWICKVYDDFSLKMMTIDQSI